MKKQKKTYNKCFRTLSLVVSALVLVTCLLPIAASAETPQRIVRVGYYKNSGFQDYDGETGIYSGYSYEFLMALQQYTDWTYEFVPVSFYDGLEMLKNGEIDLMNNVSKTDEREAFYDFSTLNSGENVAYLVMKPGDTRVAYEDLEAIQTIRIGLARDSIYSERLMSYFEENGISPEILWYDTRDEVTSAFENGEADAYIITSSTKTDEHIILSFSPDSYYLATTKGNNDLMREADSAIIALRANDPAFELHLSEKYYGKATENYTVLTEKEKQYLAENPIARVVYTTNWYPLCYMDENGDFAGAVRGVYDLLEERTGLKFEYVPVDPENDSTDIVDAYNAQILAEQPTDFSGSGIYDVKLTKSFVSPPLVEVANNLLSPGDTIALVDGDYLSEVSRAVYGDSFDYVLYASVDECVNAVKDGKADGTVLISYESEFYRQMREYSTLTYTIVDEGSYSMSIAVSNQADPRLYSIIQKGLNSISTGEISNIFNNTLISLQNDDFLTLVYNHPYQSLTVIAVLVSLIVGLAVGYAFIRKLAKQNEIINDKNTALQSANRATTDFFSRMSHDMRTPMNGILGMAKLSEDEESVGVLKENIAKIEDSGEYLLGLINDSLDFQRIESGKLQLSAEIVSSHDIFRSITEMVSTSVEKKHLSFRTSAEGIISDCYIRVDAVRIKQVLLNLLSNAIKFTPEGGTVTATASCTGREGMVSHVSFVISDTGIGMSEEFIKNKMFVPFSQEQNEVTGQYAGSGLGLSIVKSLVELMGGEIKVESTPGEGTTFTVSLDIERVDPTEVTEASRKKKQENKDVTALLRGKNILLAEDHPLNAEIATKLLKKVGCTVDWAQNGRKALEKFTSSEENEYDAVLMDIRMPEMDGLQVAEHIRALSRPDAATVPIIAMTANAYDEDVQKSIDAGMNAHLGKPIDPARMYSTLAKLIAKE